MEEKTFPTRLVILLFVVAFPLFIFGQQMPIDELIHHQIEQADSLKSQKQYKAAIPLLMHLFALPDYPQAKTSSKGNIYHKLGANYLSIRDYDQAILYLDTSINLRLTDISNNQEDIAHSYFLRGLCHSGLNLYESALPDFLTAINYSENYPEEVRSLQKNKERLSQYLSYTARSFKEIGDFGQAAHYYDEALSKTLDNYGKNHIATAKLYSSLGVFYYQINDTTKVFDMYNQALGIYSNLGGDKNLKEVLMVQNNIASAHLQFKQYQEAKKRFETIYEYLLNNEHAYKEVIFIDLKRKCLSNLGYTELALKDFQLARKYYSEAFDLAQKLNPSGSVYSIELSRAYEGLGDVDLAEKKYDAALQQYQQATRSLCIDYLPKNNFSLPSIKEEIIIDKISLKRVLALKAKTLFLAAQENRDVNYLEAAFQTYQCIDLLISQIRQSFQSDVSRYDIVEGTIPIYEKATETALQLHQLKQEQKYAKAAFDFASKNKAIVLLEGVQDEKALFTGIPSDLLAQEKNLKKQFYDLEMAIFKLEEATTKNMASIDSVKQERFEVSRNYDKLIAQLEKDYPAYYQLKYSLSQQTDVAKIQQNLPPHAAMIEYFVGFDSLYIFTLTAQQLSCYTSAKPVNFDQQCRDFRNASSGLQPLDLPEFATLANGLYTLLLDKALNGLAPQDIQRLFIIPDDLLLEISFDALLYTPLTSTQLTANWSAPDLPYLLRKYAISYAYSNRLMFAGNPSKRSGQKATKLFAGFGLTYDEYTLAGINQQLLANKEKAGRNLGVLKYAVDEVQTIAQSLQGDSWANQLATKETFLQQAPYYRILHMAMHGIVDKKFPLNSALVFSREEGNENYLLTAADLYSMTLSADMAVLSACDTGAGQLQKGEGAMTLARAFNYAGCPSLVASLWSAADISTKELMVHFYQQLQEGHPKDVALQLAKIEYLKNAPPSFAKPFYWTHLALIGDPGVLELSTPSFVAQWGLQLAGLFVLVFLFLFWKIRSR